MGTYKDLCKIAAEQGYAVDNTCPVPELYFMVTQKCICISASADDFTRTQILQSVLKNIGGCKTVGYNPHK